MPEFEDLIGIKARNTTALDLYTKSKSKIFTLFQLLPPIETKDPNGDYTAENLPQAILGPFVRLITDHLFGPGKWVGKGFTKSEGGELTGYNLFMKKGEVTRAKIFDVFEAPSEIDNRRS